MKLNIAYIWTVLFIGGLSLNLTAQHKDSPWGIGVGYNQRDFTQIPNQEFGNFEFNDAFRIYLGRYLNPSFDIILNASLVPLVFENRTKEQLTDVDLNFRYKLNNGYVLKENALFSPYITMGFGVNMQEEIGNSLNSAAPVGAGIRLNIGSVVSMEVEGKYHINMGNFQDYASINYGFNFNLGKGPKEKSPGTSPSANSRDADQDGVLDQDDACPDLAGPASLSGCPDSDGDGLADLEDLCPQEAGPRDRQGCPLFDSDKDGIEDAEDKCPYKPGFIQFNGCPDSDGDGVGDHEDDCPDEVGSVDNKGCPVVEVVNDDIKEQLETVKDNVQFESGSSTLTESSYSVLDIVVRIMNENPDFYLRITGYTDNSGSASRNLWLSEKRAEACNNYLIEKGVRDGRIAYRGYGAANAVASNDTPEGRAKNRRVEFEMLIPRTDDKN